MDGKGRLGAAGHIVQKTLLAAGVVVLFREPLPDEFEQLLQAFVEVEALTGLGGGEGGVFQLTQVLDAVALQVGFGLDGGIAQFRTGLDVEQKQQPVHEAQRFEAELFGQVGVVAVVEFFLRHLPLVADGLVADQFDAFAQRILEIGGYFKSMAMRAFIQRVEQGGFPLGRQHGNTAEQCSHAAQAAIIPRAEQLGQLHLQAGLARPFGTFDQHPVLVVHQQHPAWRCVVGKKPAGECVFPAQQAMALCIVPGPTGHCSTLRSRLGVPADGSSQGYALCVTRRQLQGRQFFFTRQGHRSADGQQWCAAAVLVQGQHGQFALARTVGQREVLRVHGIVQRFQNGGCQCLQVLGT